MVDSVYTFCDTSGGMPVYIDSPMWQRGHTLKFGAAYARDSSCALITDTANTYPNNTIASFHVLLPHNSMWWGGYGNYYFKFWHRFETDSLFDGCWIEFSTDSGQHWMPVDSFVDLSWMNCHLYQSHSSGSTYDTLINGHKAWSGSSHGWIYTALHLNPYFPIKPTRGGDINAVRFVFASDSIDNQKAGWMIDELDLGFVYMTGGLDNIQHYPSLPIYPNPSATGHYHISYPQHFVTGNVQVYNLHGQEILHQALEPELQLSENQAPGLYYYRIQFEGQTYTGILQK